MQTIKVKPAQEPNADGSGKVVIARVDEGQPSGQVFIAVGIDKSGEQVEYNVVKTPLINQLLLDRMIIEINDEPKKTSASRGG